MYGLMHTPNIQHNMRKPIITLDLQRGDYKLIAQMTGYSVHTVSSQLRGERTLTDKVKNAVIKIIKSRELLLNDAVVKKNRFVTADNKLQDNNSMNCMSQQNVRTS